MSGKLKPRALPGSIEVKMHPLSIKRAVANMVVNAARYGNGWIKVSSGTEPNRAWFQVEDDGPGFAPEQRKHLFQPFVRGDSARTISGTGLGLAIVQRIVDNHNGMLELGTSERGGLSIRAWLPVPVTRAQGTTKEVNKREARCLPFLDCFQLIDNERIRLQKQEQFSRCSGRLTAFGFPAFDQVITYPNGDSKILLT